MTANVTQAKKPSAFICRRLFLLFPHDTFFAAAVTTAFGFDIVWGTDRVFA